MADAHVTIGGHPVSRIVLSVPGVGPWFADADMAGAPELSGRVDIVIGKARLSGTVEAAASGTFGQRRRVRVIAGAGGWGALVAAKDYHNDAGIRARTVAEDAARAVGETLGSFAGTSERLGADYVRAAGAASRALEGAAKGAAWWVAYDGATHVGTRVSAAAPAGSYTVRSYDARHRVALLSIEDLSLVGVGSILTENLDEPATIAALEVTIDGNGSRVIAWCGSGHQVADALRAIVGRLTDTPLRGAYRYRVVNMVSDRVNLQVVRKRTGLPDLLTIPMWPGVAGAHAQLAPGAEVIVQFLDDGDPEQPAITGFVGRGASGHVPTVLELGGANGAEAARKGDAVECPLPPGIFTGTISGAPASGVITFPVMKLIGVITGGSPKVKIAT